MNVKLLNRIVAKSIDFFIVIALCEIIPKIGYFAGLAYLLTADGLFYGRSIGKRLMGLKVVYYITDSTTSCGYRESVYRNSLFAAGYLLAGLFGAVPLLGGILAFVIITAVLVFESLVMIGSEEGMRFGDEFAKTRVVEDKEGGTHVS